VTGGHGGQAEGDPGDASALAPRAAGVPRPGAGDDALVVGPAVDRDLPLDTHLHTDLSPDADVPIDVYGALAVERGIPEIVITDHLDFDPRAPAFAFADFSRRERVVREAAERWAEHGVTIRFGVEISYESDREEEIRGHLAAHPYDFAIGSVHVPAWSPYARHRVGQWIAGRSFAEVVRPYFTEVERAIRSGLFDTLGHLDVVKKYVVEHIPAAAFAAAPEVYEPALRALVEAGMGLEVNASGLRHAPGETYPPPWTVARYRELGGTLVTTGSDAHLARSFAFGLATAYGIAARAGFREVAVRRRPGDPPAGEREAIPARILGAWAAGGPARDGSAAGAGDRRGPNVGGRASL
jgi:histidinol-phosphatase (PHP family)